MNNDNDDIVKQEEVEEAISPTLSNLIAEANSTIETAKEKILAAYNYAIDKE